MEDSTVRPGGGSVMESSMWSGADSGASFGSEEAPGASLPLSLNGHHGLAASSTSQGLEDSSISMRSVDSVYSSVTDSATSSGVFPSQPGVGSERRDLDDFLSLNNKTALDNVDDLVNFNKVDDGSEAGPPPPIIAFEENKTIRHPETEMLS